MRDLIYTVDKWTSYLWKRVLKESAPLSELVATAKKNIPTFDSFAREVFARIYASPPLCERSRPEDAWARSLHTALDELPSFQKLAAHCARNKEFAAAATGSVLEQLVDQLPAPKKAPLADPEERRKEVRGLLEFLNALNTDDPKRPELERALEEAKRAGKSAVESMQALALTLSPDDVRQALRRSVDGAATEVEELSAAAAGLTGFGGTSTVGDATQSALGEALKENDTLKRLGLLAGRMRRIAMNKRRTRTKTAASELSDITVGNDLGRVLPHELMKLTDPLLALDFFRAFMERALLQYELAGKEREGRGPVVVLIDDSDSMDGAPSTFAKATALALADLALADRRPCRLIRFSHRINGVLDLRPTDLTPTKESTRELIAFLAGPVDGGTNFEIPLRAARTAIDNEPVFERADVVLITDGEAELSAEFLAEWKRRGARDGTTTYAVHIGGSTPAVLRALTTEIVELRSLIPDQLEAALFARIAQ